MLAKAALFTAVLSACVGAANASAQAIWDPKITSPSAVTIWAAGSTYNVTWLVTAIVFRDTILI